MTQLTEHARTTLALALSEYASGFSLNLTPQETAAAKALATRIFNARSIDVDDAEPGDGVRADETVWTDAELGLDDDDAPGLAPVS